MKKKKTIEDLLKEPKSEFEEFLVISLAIQNYDYLNFKYRKNSLETLKDSLYHSIQNQIEKYGGKIYHSFRNNRLLIISPLRDENNLNDIMSEIDYQIKRPFKIEDRYEYLSAKYGVSIHSKEYTLEQSIKNAELALRMAKERKETIQIFNNDLQRSFLEESRIQSELLSIISTIGENKKYSDKKSPFEIYFQPQISLGKREIIGLESLIRWNHDDLGSISTQLFLGIARKFNLMSVLDNYILELVIRSKGEINDTEENFNCAINVCSKNFDYNYIRNLISVCNNYGVDPSEITIELTETSIANSIGLKKTFYLMRDYGIGVHIDDFGTYHSNLQELAKLSKIDDNKVISTLKIDKKFVSDISEGDSSFFDICLYIGEKLGYNLIAEGVETKEQLIYIEEKKKEKLAEERSLYYQGYLFAKPMPTLTLKKVLENNSSILFKHLEDKIDFN